MQFHIERFSLKKLNELEVKEKYRAEISKRLVSLENLVDEVELLQRISDFQINRV
jgi:hypothetical protein